uniref:Putative secreted protein n=1 Tax=Ixodes ricinus TaxID=34613 RepID=A0A147BB92_IXORI
MKLLAYLYEFFTSLFFGSSVGTTNSNVCYSNIEAKKQQVSLTRITPPSNRCRYTALPSPNPHLPFCINVHSLLFALIPNPFNRFSTGLEQIPELYKPRL